MFNSSLPYTIAIPFAKYRYPLDAQMRLSIPQSPRLMSSDSIGAKRVGHIISESFLPRKKMLEYS